MSDILEGLGTLAAAPVPGWVFFVIFAVKAVLSLILGVHAVAMSKRILEPAERAFASSLGWMMILNLVVYSAFFAFAFIIGAAVLSGLGLVIFGPGLYAVVRAFRAWARLADRMVIDDGPPRRRKGSTP